LIITISLYYPPPETTKTKAIVSVQFHLNPNQINSLII